jgi:hypothetical protein
MTELTRIWVKSQISERIPQTGAVRADQIAGWTFNMDSRNAIFRVAVSGSTDKVALASCLRDQQDALVAGFLAVLEEALGADARYVVVEPVRTEDVDGGSGGPGFWRLHAGTWPATPA